MPTPDKIAVTQWGTPHPLGPAQFSPISVTVGASRMLPSVVRVFSWPVTICSLDSVELSEAPNPNCFLITPGRHVFTFVPRAGAGGLTFETCLDPGGQYVIKADLQSNQCRMERLP